MNRPESDAPDRDRRQFFGRFIKTAAARGQMAQQPGCLACGACARGCETGALSLEIRAGTMIKSWDEERCGKCGRCIERCPDSLLRFEKVDKPGQERAAKIELFRFQAVTCLSCGTVIRVEDGPACITCRRRGLAPALDA